MKPDWKDAPKWAQYLACDGDWQSDDEDYPPLKGDWHWYVEKPEADDEMNYWKIETLTKQSILRVDGASALDRQHWRDSLEKRPEME